MTANLNVRQSDLKEALRILTRSLPRKQSGECILSFDGTSLLIEVPGASVSVPAVGRWDIEVRLAGSVLLAIGKVLPADDPVCLQVTDERFFIGKLGMPCRVQARTTNRIEIPLNPSLPDLLRVAADCSSEQIAASGLSKLVAAAIEARDQLLDRAMTHLTKLDVSKDALLQLIDESTRRTPNS